jgi:hypothetical protein
MSHNSPGAVLHESERPAKAIMPVSFETGAGICLYPANVSMDVDFSDVIAFGGSVFVEPLRACDQNALIRSAGRPSGPGLFCCEPAACSVSINLREPFSMTLRPSGLNSEFGGLPLQERHI